MLILKLKCCFSLSSSFTALGLKSSAKLNEIKKKYYQLAKLYHPDLNKTDQNAQKKFTQITKAYRYIVENYDKQTGYNESKSQTKSHQKASNSNSQTKNEKRHKVKMQQEDYQDFHEYDTFFKQAKKFRKPRLGQDIYLNVNISLKQSITGASKEVQYTKYEPCSSCVSVNFSACFSCGGKGEIYDRSIRQKVRCQNCSGKGFKNQCITCLGASYILKQVKDSIYVDKGTQDKTILKILHKGHSGYKADNGDLYVTVLVDEDSKFKVDGNNIHSSIELDFVIAACGGNVEVETVHGLKTVQISPGTQSGSQIRIFNAGLRSPYSKRFGDQITKIRIKIPQKISEKQRSLIEKLAQSSC